MSILTCNSLVARSDCLHPSLGCLFAYRGVWAVTSARAAAQGNTHIVAPEVANPDAIERIAKTRRDRRDQCVAEAKRAFRDKKNSENMSTLTKSFLPQIGKQQIKFGVGGKKKSIALATAVGGGSGVAHLVNLSDGRVLRSHKRQSGWNLAHCQVDEKLSRVTESIDDWRTLGSKCIGFYAEGTDKSQRLPIYTVGHHNTPQTRAEALRFTLAKVKKRPANVAPRPENQFGHQCVVPAFSQIEQISSVINCVERILEEAKQKESLTFRGEHEHATAIQAVARRRQAEKLIAKMKAEQLERDKLAAAKRAARDVRPTIGILVVSLVLYGLELCYDYRLQIPYLVNKSLTSGTCDTEQEEQHEAEREAARLAAESPTMKECRLLFHEIDEDNSGALDRDEIKLLAKRLGKTLSKRALDKAMAEMDADNSGEIDFGT